MATTGTNLKYFVGFTGIGGSVIEGSKSIPAYIYQANGWKNRPQEANGYVNVINGVLVGEAGADPFVDTVGAYTVRINYEQPVQAITVRHLAHLFTPAQVTPTLSGMKPYRVTRQQEQRARNSKTTLLRTISWVLNKMV